MFLLYITWQTFLSTERDHLSKLKPVKFGEAVLDIPSENDFFLIFLIHV